MFQSSRESNRKRIKRVRARLRHVARRETAPQIPVEALPAVLGHRLLQDGLGNRLGGTRIGGERTRDGSGSVRDGREMSAEERESGAKEIKEREERDDISAWSHLPVPVRGEFDHGDAVVTRQGAQLVAEELRGGGGNRARPCVVTHSLPCCMHVVLPRRTSLLR